MSEVVNVWGGERLGGERLTIGITGSLDLLESLESLDLLELLT